MTRPTATEPVSVTLVGVEVAREPASTVGPRGHHMLQGREPGGIPRYWPRGCPTRAFGGPRRLSKPRQPCLSQRALCSRQTPGVANEAPESNRCAPVSGIEITSRCR